MNDTPLICKDEPLEDSAAVLCRAAGVQLAPTVTGEMMYMPGGLQTITPFGGGQGHPITVRVDEAGARALNEQHAAIVARGDKPMFDFNHEDGAASFWPEQYVFRDGAIYCRGEWSARGKREVEGKEWRFFSPVFHVSKKLGATPQNPAAIVCRTWAKPNMGGLVNDPAFHTISPLWARDAANEAAASAGAHPDNPSHIMKPEELAALQAKNAELQKELDALKQQQAALKAKNETDALVAAQIAAKEAEHRANAATIELEAVKAKNQQQSDAISARNKSDASAAVKRAVERGAIAAKDQATQDALVAKATDDPGFLAIIDNLSGNPALGGRITPPQVSVVRESSSATMKAFAAILARNAKIPLSPITAKDKGACAREAAAIFAKDIEKDDVLSMMTMDEAIKAADVSSDQVGLLAGTLVLQRSLPLLQYDYPLLGGITQDFSDAPGLLNQTEVTRILLRPAVQTYDPTPDSGGRPKGWTTVSPAQSVDVPVKLDEHVGIPIVFGVQDLAKTVRNLFAEQAPQTLHALGGYAVNKLTALMTAANFNAYKGTSLAAGATTSGSTTVTVTSTANAYVGAQIAGTGIAVPTYVAEVVDGTTLRLTQAATATNTGLTLTLSGGRVPTAYATYAKALADFDVASLGDLSSAFDVNEVPSQDRFTLLNAAYHTKLANTPVLNSFFAATQKPEIITKGALPELQGFTPLKAPWFPSSSNRVGFAFHKAALTLKSRLPQDFTQAVGAMVPGSVTTVTVPGGISVLLVQYVSLQGGYAEWRPEVILGAAVGDRRCGLVLTSQ